MLFTPFHIKRFVDHLGVGHSTHARDLLADLMISRLEKNHRCRPQAERNFYKGIKKLKRHFDKAVRAAERKAIQKQKEIVYPPPPEVFFFKPDRKFIYEARHFLRWADRIFAKAMNENARMAMYGYIKSEALRSERYDEMMSKTFFNPDRLDSRLRSLAAVVRHVFSDEKKQHVEYACSLSEAHFLVRIITPHGMKIAAEKASNCLYSPIRPDRDDPHRRRVLNRSRFGYFQARDADNNCVATIAIDFDKARLAYEGNHRYDENRNLQTSILPEHEFLIDKWESYFAQKYPDMDAKKPYGTLGYFRFAQNFSLE